jgi:4-diphosphocytidyl-2-C-methyl-D-erythritol kinase
MASVELKSYAKINLFLCITDVLPNGYHRLDMVNARISLHDVILCRIGRSGGGVHLKVDDPSIPDDHTNTAYKAAQRFLEQIRSRNSVEISIQKHIPSGAGLGGGSSNAASVLSALNELFDYPLTTPELMHIGTGIGADVPFFLGKGCSFVQGIGERVMDLIVDSSFCAEPLFLVLCSPDHHVSTQDAYHLWDRKGNRKPVSPAPLLHCLLNGARDELPSCLFNSFESVIYPEYPELKKVYTTFCQVSPTQPLLSGSGSNMFSLHNSEKEAHQVVKKLAKKNYPGKVCQLKMF